MMALDGHTLPYYFADGFCEPTTKIPFTLVWFNDDFRFIFTLQVFVGRMTKIDDRYWTETDLFIHSSLPNNSDTSYGVLIPIKGTSFSYAQNQVFHVLNSFHILKLEPLFSTQYIDLFCYLRRLFQCAYSTT